MKRFLSILLVAVMLVGILAGCGTEPVDETTDPPTSGEPVEGGDTTETTWGIEPMSEPITMNLGYFSGAMHALPWYVMD